MNRVKRNTLVLILVLFHSSFLFSSNFHEHLFALPFPEHIAAQHEAIFALPKEKQLLSSFFSPDEKQRLSRFFSSNEAKHTQSSLYWKRKVWQHMVRGDTLKQLCESMPGRREDNLKQLLSFNAHQSTSLTHRKIDYEMCEILRKSILLNLPKDAFLIIYTAYFQEEPLENRRVISATVSRRFFASNQHEKQSALVQVAQSYGSKLIYRVSLQRNKLLKQGIALSQDILDLLKSQTIAGIDVVGSLFEETYTYPYTQQEIQYRLESIFKFASTSRLVLVFHLFEERNDDSFYRALKASLHNRKTPLFLEIGHIAALNNEWIDLFTSNPALHVLFHVNPQSNHLLHGTPYATLSRLAKRLEKKGLPVALGSDGRGILPASSYLEQKRHLSSNLSSYSFLSIRDDLFVSKKYFTKQ